MPKIIKIAAGLIVAALIAIVVIIKTTDINQYKPELIGLVEEATGRKLVPRAYGHC